MQTQAPEADADLLRLRSAVQAAHRACILARSDMHKKHLLKAAQIRLISYSKHLNRQASAAYRE